MADTPTFHTPPSILAIAHSYSTPDWRDIMANPPLSLTDFYKRFIQPHREARSSAKIPKDTGDLSTGKLGDCR